LKRKTKQTPAGETTKAFLQGFAELKGEVRKGGRGEFERGLFPKFQQSRWGCWYKKKGVKQMGGGINLEKGKNKEDRSLQREDPNTVGHRKHEKPRGVVRQVEKIQVNRKKALRGGSSNKFRARGKKRATELVKKDLA